MEQRNIVISTDYIDFIYENIKKVTSLDKNYNKERLVYLLKTNHSFTKDTLSFLEYKEMNMDNFITEDLAERIDVINDTKEEIPYEEIKIEITESDIDYFYKSIKKRYDMYIPFIFDSHIIIALLNNQKAFFSLKARELDNDDFFKRQLMSTIQQVLVGRSEPAPCAKARVKQDYYDLFSKLTRRE